MQATHNGPLEEKPERGSVVACNDTSLEVSFPEEFTLGADQPWRLDVGQCNVVFDRMEEAIRQLRHDPDAPISPQNKTSGPEAIIRGTYVRDILLRSFGHRAQLEGAFGSALNLARQEITFSLEGVFNEDARVVSWIRRYSHPNPVVVEGDPVLEGLNQTQMRAIAMMLNNRFCLVQGVRL